MRPTIVVRRSIRGQFFFDVNSCFDRFTFDPFFCRNFFFSRRRFFEPVILPYAYPVPYYPMNYDQSQPQYATDNSYQQGVEQGRLEAEVGGLKEELSRLTNELAQSRAADTAKSAAPKSEPAELPIILVYRDGRKREIQSYAIVGSTLWVLTARTAVKVPLSQLDLETTRKINDERGMEFRVP